MSDASDAALLPNTFCLPRRRTPPPYDRWLAAAANNLFAGTGGQCERMSEDDWRGGGKEVSLISFAVTLVSGRIVSLRRTRESEFADLQICQAIE